MVVMGKYATISVLREVKELLEKEKGGMDWSEYLLKLYREARLAEARASYEELRRLLSEEDLESILESSREFRRGFRLR